MTVPDFHRFVSDSTPQTITKRIWVLYGQTGDVFYHNLLHGTVTLRRTLELWALENGMELVVFLRSDGVLDFSGNPDPTAAQQLFENIRQRRAPKYGQTPGGTDQGRVATPAANASTTQAEDTAAQAQQAARNAQEMAGGSGQGIQNTFTKLTQMLQNTTHPCLLIVDDFYILHQTHERNAQTHALAFNIWNVVDKDWHDQIAASNMAVFLCPGAEKGDKYPLMRRLFPDTQKKVEFKILAGPEKMEIRAAVERMASRHHFSISAPGAIAKQLQIHENLGIALAEVRRVACSGKERILLMDILQLPPINETSVEEIKKELNELVGLQELKDKVVALEAKARGFRRKLLDGESELPDETLHLVFAGEPGTGKTMVANIVGRFFHALGLLRRSDVKDITAATVMSSNVGETREKTKQAIEDALGGCLFIDEAHQFGDKDSLQAKEAIQALVPMAWNHRHEMVIILAGYADKMLDFYTMDDGLNSRFPEHGYISFPSYSKDELWTILERELRKKGYSVSDDAVQRIRAVLRRRMKRKKFGNARGVYNLVGEILQNHEVSLHPDSRTITQDDLPPLIRQDLAMFEQAKAALDKMIGLGPVKEKINAIVNEISFDLEEEAFGRGTGSLQVHPGNMLFVGPPGTGKTTVARLMGNLLFGLGCVERPQVLEVSRGHLIGRYQGESTANLHKELATARDGIFFIDEAYALALDSNDTYGNELVGELVDQITKPENAGTVFILAGYEDNMDGFIQKNAGLDRRFPQRIVFPNFTPDACMELARDNIEAINCSYEDGILEHIRILSAEAAAQKGLNFGNAGWVNGLVAGALARMKQRVRSANIPPSDPGRKRLLISDFPEAISSGPSSPAQPPPDSLLIYDWVPRSEAVHLWQPCQEWGGYSPEALGQEIAKCAFQIVVTNQSGDQGAGTGFFVTADGVMVTSAHVVKNAAKLRVHCGRNRMERDARILQVDESLDLALIVVDTERLLTPLPLGVSLDMEELMELIILGNAHVQPGEPCRLVMARVGRNDKANAVDFETDGDIEEGFSGGPVWCVRQSAVVGVIKGGYGRSATASVRIEHVRGMLINAGYSIQPEQRAHEE